MLIYKFKFEISKLDHFKLELFRVNSCKLNIIEIPMSLNVNKLKQS